MAWKDVRIIRIGTVSDLYCSVQNCNPACIPKHLIKIYIQTIILNFYFYVHTVHCYCLLFICFMPSVPSEIWSEHLPHTSTEPCCYTTLSGTAFLLLLLLLEQLNSTSPIQVISPPCSWTEFPVYFSKLEKYFQFLRDLEKRRPKLALKTALN
jgi:hypothetical protein